MPSVTISLQAGGAILSISVGAPGGRALAMQQAGVEAPPPLQINALIDTGATATAVDSRILQSLGLQPRGTVRVMTAAGIHQRYRYAIGLSLPINGVSFPISQALQVTEISLPTGGFAAILGRDVLQSCTMFYNGPHRSVTVGI